MRLLLILGLLSSPAFAAKSEGSSGAKKFIASMVRFGFGYGSSEVEGVEPATVTDFDKPRTFFEEVDFLMPISLHFAIRETWDDSANINFYGDGVKPGEIYFTAVNLGAKFTLPLFRVQPWVGGGVTGGFIAVSDPANRNQHNWMVAFDKITKAVRGAYWQAGLDIMVTRDMGLRLGVQQEKIRTDRYSNLDNVALEFDHTMVMFGVCGHMFQ